MLLAYKVSPSLFPFLFLILFSTLLTLVLYSQFLVGLNSTYVAIQPIVERGATFEARLRKAIEELGKSDEQRLRFAKEAKVASEAKASSEEENAKLKVEKVELQ